MPSRTIAALSPLLLIACDDDGPQTVDAGPDARARDAGGGSDDAGIDAGGDDAGMDSDGGGADGGRLDAGPVDSGGADTGDPCSMGCPPDRFDVDGNPLTGECGCEYACTRSPLNPRAGIKNAPVDDPACARCGTSSFGGRNAQRRKARSDRLAARGGARAVGVHELS
jgi:hypothetical protein